MLHACWKGCRAGARAPLGPAEAGGALRSIVKRQVPVSHQCMPNLGV